MKFSNKLLLCFYALAICDWILAAPEPKGKLNKTLEEVTKADFIYFNEDPIITSEEKAMDRQIEMLNSILVWPFKFFCDVLKNGLKDWEYLATRDFVERSKKWIKG
ncbi:uncharacterized protein LOC108029915 [Drosophila biarmipes]|uniref:uncharacterized protein LOC108029915 n=1 Tax=Drosophila biarmipes TaxID=125945 RepID=UPI0007E856FD|nr:uncharacterized protein LOC108029915 [Drosophila biarmipes]